MSMTLSTSNYSTTLAGPQFSNFAPVPQPGSQLLEALAGLFSALAPLMQGLGFQGNPTSNRFGNNFQQNFGPQGFPQGFGPQGFPQGFGPQGFPQPTGFNGTSTFNNQLFVGQQPMNKDTATQVLQSNWDKVAGKNGGKGFRREDLENIAQDPTASGELKAAANYFLGSELEFKNLDRSNATKHGNFHQKADGFVGRADVDAALDGIPFTPKEQSIIETLRSHRVALSNGDQLFGQGDLGKVLTTGLLPDGQPASPAMLFAAQYALSNPAFFNKLQETYLARNPGVDGPRNDGLVGFQDMDTALAKR